MNIPGKRGLGTITTEQLEASIRRIDRRIEEIKDFQGKLISIDDTAALDGVQATIDQTLSSIFGADSNDYERYSGATKLYYYLPGSGIQNIANTAFELLCAAKLGLQEELEDISQAEANRPLRAYEGLDLHSEIERECRNSIWTAITPRP